METYSARTSEAAQAYPRPLTRRVYPSYRNRGRRANAGKMSFKEKFVMQCIICGMIVTAVLVIKLVNTAPANRLSHTLSIALRDNISGESVKNGFANTINAMSEMSDSIKNVFGHSSENNGTSNIQPEMVPAESSNPAETAYPAQTALPNQPAGTEAGTADRQFYETDNDFRIDEDILEEMDKGQLSDNGSSKNSAAPN